ncbi:MAG: hypothetical protein U1E46_15095 [Hyphomicrobiales bacterium]
MLEALIRDGTIVPLILGLMAVEALALLLWRARTGTGPRPLPLLVNLAAGASLLGALWAVLSGAGIPIVGGLLALALFAHVADLALRWRS